MQKKQKIFKIILFIAGALLSILLVLALLIPLSYGSSESYISQVSLQLARSNGFAKNALILEFGPTDQQAQAQSDLQVALPLFEREQTTLQQDGLQDILSQAQGNYLALVTATTTIIHEASPDPKQVAIIVDNSRSYNMVMNSYLIALQQKANDFNAHLVLFQEVLLVLIIVDGASLLVLTRQPRIVIQ